MKEFLAVLRYLHKSIVILTVISYGYTCYTSLRSYVPRCTLVNLTCVCVLLLDCSVYVIIFK